MPPQNRSPSRKRPRRNSRKQGGHLKRQKMLEGVAKERVESLFGQANAIHGTNPELANRYVLLSRKIAMAAKIQIPTKLKRTVCRQCKGLLVPGTNMRYRLNRKLHYGTFLTVTCLSCGHITRYIVKGRARSKKIDMVKSAAPAKRGRR